MKQEAKAGPTAGPLVRLSGKARSQLSALASRSADGRLVRRAQALLWLDAGESPTVVARRQRVTRQMLYGLVDRFQERQGRPLPERIQDTPRRGRPAAKRQLASQVVGELLPRPPESYGYRAQDWTIPMLRQQLQQQHQTAVSEDTLARALSDLGYRYKRPRYSLVRREPHWRQVKGGSKTA